MIGWRTLRAHFEWIMKFVFDIWQMATNLNLNDFINTFIACAPVATDIYIYILYIFSSFLSLLLSHLLSWHRSLVTQTNRLKMRYAILMSIDERPPTPSIRVFIEMKFDRECDVCIHAMHVVWMDISPHSSGIRNCSLTKITERLNWQTHIIHSGDVFSERRKWKEKKNPNNLCVPCAIYMINANLKFI